MLAPFAYVVGEFLGARRLKARHTTWATCTAEFKASQAINRP